MNQDSNNIHFQLFTNENLEQLKIAAAIAREFGWHFNTEEYNTFLKEGCMNYKRRLVFWKQFTGCNLAMQKDKIFTFCNGTKGREINFPKDYDIYIEILKQSIKLPIEVQINSIHKALVTSDYVEVACQKFTFDKIEELYNAVQKQKENK